MNYSIFIPSIVLMCTACTASTSTQAIHGPESLHTHGHNGHKHTHFQDAKKYATRWNDPKRDAYQKPGQIIEAMKLTPGATAVDLGTGTGYLLSHLSQAVGAQGHVIALDIEPNMIAYIDKAIKDEELANITPQLAAADNPNLNHASADAIVALNVWHHMEQRVAYGARVAQALKPGGVFVIVDFIKNQQLEHGPPKEMRLSAHQVIEELTQAGFDAQILEETMPRHYIVRGTVSKKNLE